MHIGPRVPSLGVSCCFLYRSAQPPTPSPLPFPPPCSPIGDAFRQRLRMFPSLVNCCTIDWFREWPMEALKSVASSFFTDVELESDSNPQLLQVREGEGGSQQ